MIKANFVYALFYTGEEIDMDLVSTEQADSPILWIRIDSAMTILRQVKIEQVFM